MAYLVNSLGKSLRLWCALVTLGLAGGLAVSAQGQIGEQSDASDGVNWQDAPPDSLLGVWAVDGKCQSAVSEKLIFSRGGYRWSRVDGSWGFARGKFSYSNSSASRVLFRLQRLDPIDGYDAILDISGRELRKTNPFASTTVEYRYCPDIPPF